MNNIKKARFEKNITQIELYKRTGIWPSKLSLIENGYLSANDAEKTRLSNALDVGKDWLFPEERE